MKKLLISSRGISFEEEILSGTFLPRNLAERSLYQDWGLQSRGVSWYSSSAVYSAASGTQSM